MCAFEPQNILLAGKASKGRGHVGQGHVQHIASRSRGAGQAWVGADCSSQTMSETSRFPEDCIRMKLKGTSRTYCLTHWYNQMHHWT